MDQLEILGSVVRSLDEEIKNVSTGILDGSFNTIEAYKERVGYLRGLRQSRELVVSASHEYDESDD